MTAKATTAKPRAKRAVAKKNDVERILLPANLEMNGLEESFSLLRAKFPPTYQKCILDGANINVIDASGIQLLVNFVTSVKQKGCVVEWDNYSLQAYQLANELGLVEQLGD
jgi:ABC-type transporter Mla MlaB component